MKSPTNANLKAAKPKIPVVAAIVVGVAAVVGLAWAGIALFNKSSKTDTNYAQEAAGPLEKALADIGGVKQCGRGNTGRGSDSNQPSYYAIYEIPGSREQATNLIRQAAGVSGYTLTDGTLPPDPQDNVFLADHTSKSSAYPELENGNTILNVEIFGSSTYSGEGDQFCTVTKRDSPSADKTTMRYTLGLPAFRR